MLSSVRKLRHWVDKQGIAVSELGLELRQWHFGDKLLHGVPSFPIWCHPASPQAGTETNSSEPLSDVLSGSSSYCFRARCWPMHLSSETKVTKNETIFNEYSLFQRLCHRQCVPGKPASLLLRQITQLLYLRHFQHLTYRNMTKMFYFRFTNTIKICQTIQSKFIISKYLWVLFGER